MAKSISSPGVRIVTATVVVAAACAVSRQSDFQRLLHRKLVRRVREAISGDSFHLEARDARPVTNSHHDSAPTGITMDVIPQRLIAMNSVISKWGRAALLHRIPTGHLSRR